MHGFGIMNIRDIIDKYNGTINYEQQGDNYLMCRCALEKVVNSFLIIKIVQNMPYITEYAKLSF